MKKRLQMIITILGLSLFVTACSGSSEQETVNEEPAETEVVSQEGQESEPEGQKILVAYFTRLENTDGDVNTVVQGGGPYGSIGESLESADVDAMASASITLRDGEPVGNAQALAEDIQAEVGGDLFSIQTEEKYPVDYNALIDAGENENAESARPQLQTHVENMQDYDIVFLGFPNWWYDMPMAVYSFLEEYDFSGKTVIPFATSAGSGFSDAIASIQTALPDANVETNGLHIPMEDVANAQPQVAEWIAQLGISKAEETEDQSASQGAGETGTFTDGSTPEYSGRQIRLVVDGEEVIIDMYDNTAADAFIAELPLENISFYDLSGIEKPAETPDVPFSIGDVEPGYDPVTGEMVIYRPWGNFTIFYGDFRHSEELVPLGKVESGLEILSGQTEDFTGTLELVE